LTRKADQTRERLMACAKAEFLAHGFADASMRTLAAAAGVTTGAIYRYFPDKDALFAAVTQEAVDALEHAMITMTSAAFDGLSRGISYEKQQSKLNLETLFNIIYRHFDAFYLVFVCAKGSSREGFLARLIDMETAGTLAYVEQLKARHHSSYLLGEASLHILSEAYFNALLEPIRHRMDRETAMGHLRFLNGFFTDGWKGFEDKIIGL